MTDPKMRNSRRYALVASAPPPMTVELAGHDGHGDDDGRHEPDQGDAGREMGSGPEAEGQARERHGDDDEQDQAHRGPGGKRSVA